MTRLTLAQELAQLEEVAPTDFDPEDVQVTGADPEDALPVSSEAREHYVDVAPSAIRKLQDSIADPKYKGAKITRKQLMDAEDESDISSAEDGEDDDGIQHFDEDHDGPSDSNSEESENDVDEFHRDVSPSIPDTKETEPPEELSVTLRKTRDEDRKKGKAVSRQLALWDNLLDARIRLQKSVGAVSCFPQPNQLSQYTTLERVHDSLNKMLEESMLLSDELFGLQEDLLLMNDSVHAPPRKKRKIDGTDDESLASQLRDETEAASAIEQVYHPHLVKTLNKWSSKVQAVAPSVLLPSNRNAFNKGSSHIKSATQLIDETLSEHGKVLARSRIYRGKGTRLGIVSEKDDSAENEDPEVFDDTDFYQQLLRDVIDARRSGESGADDWMAVQKQKKARKKVDTKASKGRKLRYEIHEKMQNFMVPVPVQGSWHDEQVDELFSSLLGKGFQESIRLVDDVDMVENTETRVDEALKEGFRVFG